MYFNAFYEYRGGDVLGDVRDLGIAPIRQYALCVTSIHVYTYMHGLIYAGQRGA